VDWLVLGLAWHTLAESRYVPHFDFILAWNRVRAQAISELN
jgi:hypothetical protein